MNIAKSTDPNNNDTDMGRGNLKLAELSFSRIEASNQNQQGAISEREREARTVILRGCNS